ncbi:MAG: hypothetical protein F4Y57_05825 [Acidobacteria bacterium]|nr:hypothetical protein [Acidobacteriota bacterium]
MDGKRALFMHRRFPVVPGKADDPRLLTHLARSVKLDFVGNVGRAVVVHDLAGCENALGVGHLDAQTTKVAAVRAGDLDGERQRGVDLDLRGELLRRGQRGRMD